MMKVPSQHCMLAAGVCWLIYVSLELAQNGYSRATIRRLIQYMTYTMFGKRIWSYIKMMVNETNSRQVRLWQVICASDTWCSPLSNASFSALMKLSSRGTAFTTFWKVQRMFEPKWKHVSGVFFTWVSPKQTRPARDQIFPYHDKWLTSELPSSRHIHVQHNHQRNTVAVSLQSYGGRSASSCSTAYTSIYIRYCIPDSLLRVGISMPSLMKFALTSQRGDMD